MRTTDIRAFRCPPHYTQRLLWVVGVPRRYATHQSDLPDVLKVKNPKALTNILQRELGKLHITERPIHCTDVKRKKMFVKNDDKWTSEQGTDKIDKVIKSACAHQYNAWGQRIRETDREDRDKPHYKEAVEMGTIVGKLDGWGEPGSRTMQETQNAICNMVYLSKDVAREVVNGEDIKNK